jgi:hypothetical protein
VTFDLGDPKSPMGDVHSRHKQEVSRRLALQAMHVAYAFQTDQHIARQDGTDGLSLRWSGPLPLGAASKTTASASTSTSASTSAGGAVSVVFEYGEALHWNATVGCDVHREDGMGGECCEAKDTVQLCTGALTNTSGLACANATAVTLTDGSMVVQGTAPGGAAPTSVRYAYSNFPQCALFNADQLPAGPFVLPVAAAAAQTTASREAPKPPVQTPPMGLNSWNSFHCNVDERKMRGMIDALVSTGLAKAGFEYVNIDDCWQVERSANGSINVDPVRFPGGMKPLADYAHSQGLKFGVVRIEQGHSRISHLPTSQLTHSPFHSHSTSPSALHRCLRPPPSATTQYSAQREFTCQKRPGSWMHEDIDVQSYCDWGVDYLKLDACRGRGYSQANESWIKFRSAIDKCSKDRGFPMVLSVESCDDPDKCGTWIGGLANLWRTCGDIQATFASVMGNVAQNTKMAKWAGPTGGPLGGGHWNDADMVSVTLVPPQPPATSHAHPTPSPSALSSFKWVTSACR